VPGDDVESELYLLNARSGRDVRGLAFTRDEWLSMGQVRSADGTVVGSFSATGKPIDVALTGSVVALLSELSDGSRRISVFENPDRRAAPCLARCPRNARRACVGPAGSYSAADG
jgi:hypothetical protein